MIQLILCLILSDVVFGALINCSKGDLTFEKIIGLKPSIANRPLLLYQSEDDKPVTSECIAKCYTNDDCISFVLHYNTSSCFWFRHHIEGPEEYDNVLDVETAWFVKVCLTAKHCDKAWTFERIPGATLVGNDVKTLPGSLTRTQCQQYCLDEKLFQCRSAKFHLDDNHYGNSTETYGTCTLSDTDRHLFPNSYRVSSYDEEYFENQCSIDRTYKIVPNEFCAYEEYENSTLKHVDVLFEDQSKMECEKLCNSMNAFNCRGYSLLPISNAIKGELKYSCLLHSEDSKIHGPKQLMEVDFAKYYEKARCLNVSVSCSESNIVIKYEPEIKFMGRIYMQGYSEHPECFAKGLGKQVVSLKIPIFANQCGITEAKSYFQNRTLLSGTMVLQYNALIQTQGDRLIRVGCIFGNDSKVLLGTGVNITSKHSSRGSSLVNSTNSAPLVQLRVIDLYSQGEVSDTEIGQELQLVIEVVTPNVPYDIWAAHLVAMTENNEESIFLLDDRGCPTNLNVFPALTKIKTNETKKLIGTFHAFKFSTSPVVRFSVLVQFCSETCLAVDCGNGVQSFGRRKRDVKAKLVDTINSTTVSKVDRNEFEGGKTNVIERLPLEFVMLVRNSKLSPDRLIYGENNKILVAGYDLVHNEVCLDYSLFIGMIITWILIQVILVVCCLLMVRRYKNYYKEVCLRQSFEELHKNFGLGFSNLESRRVHWADNGELT